MQFEWMNECVGHSFFPHLGSLRWFKPKLHKKILVQWVCSDFAYCMGGNPYNKQARHLNYTKLDLTSVHIHSVSCVTERPNHFKGIFSAESLQFEISGPPLSILNAQWLEIVEAKITKTFNLNGNKQGASHFWNFSFQSCFWASRWFLS